MKCKHCGAEIADDSLFCEFCGKATKTAGKGPKSWMLWISIAVVFVLTTAIAVNIVDHIKKQEERKRINEEHVKKLNEGYRNAIADFDFKVGNIVVDKEGRQGAPNWVIESLNALRRIERIEGDPLFETQVDTSAFEYRYDCFMDTLVAAKRKIYEKNKDNWEDFERGVHNPLFDELRVRLRVIDTILEQTRLQGKRSVIDVQLPPKDK